MPRFKTKAQRLAAPLSNPTSEFEQHVNGSLPAESPVVDRNRKSKKRRKNHDTRQWPALLREQSPARDPSRRALATGNTASDRHEDMRPCSPQESYASTDTASVGLAEDTPQLEDHERMPHSSLENEILDSDKHKNKQTRRRPSNNRVSSYMSKRTGTFGQVVDGSRTRKTVEADPTPPSVLPAVREQRNSSQTKVVARNEGRRYIHLSHVAARRVFDPKAPKVNNGIAKHSQQEADKEKFRDYCKELETVSIRKCSPVARAGGKIGHDRTKSKARGVPSLHPFEHPITEENLDGGDAIPVGKPRKKKLAKKAKPGSGVLVRTTDKETPTHGFGQRMGKEGKRKKSFTSAEAVERGRDSEDTVSSTGCAESEGQACMECGGHEKWSKMVLCDACADGCHMFCMRPARTSVPLGVWICPRCHLMAKKHEVHLSKLGAFLEEQGIKL